MFQTRDGMSYKIQLPDGAFSRSVCSTGIGLGQLSRSLLTSIEAGCYAHYAYSVCTAWQMTAIIWVVTAADMDIIRTLLESW